MKVKRINTKFFLIHVQVIRMSAWILLFALPAMTAGAVEINGIRPDHMEVAQWERVTFTMEIDAPFTNPYDPDDIRVDALVRSPSGRSWIAPVFFIQPYSLNLRDGHETIAPGSAPRWEARLSFNEAGIHTVVFRAAAHNEKAESPPFRITVKEAEASARGIIRRCPEDHRYFMTEQGASFFPVGANVCWSQGEKGVFMYDEWLARYAEAGCNWFRVWLSPMWVTCALNTMKTGYNHIDQKNAARFDHVMALAEQYGMTVMPVFDSFNIIWTKEYGLYPDTPFTIENGGPIDTPESYFTNPEMIRAYRNRLRYIVARWGYSASIFAWEFWNEVDLTDNLDTAAIANWHRDQARFLRDTDPWKHLISTSFSRSSGIPEIDTLPEMDFVQTHSYNLPDPVTAFEQHRIRKKAAATRPHFHGEFGCNSYSGTDTDTRDPEGIHIHNALFAAPGQQQAAAPMSWWWDSYIHPRNFYPIYAAFNNWIKDFDFIAQKPAPLQYAIEYTGSEDALPLMDLTLMPEQKSWDPAPFNMPATVHIYKDGRWKSDAPLSALLHGPAHTDLLNPVTFQFHAPRATTFRIETGDVSGWGGAAISIVLDGKTVLEESFTDPDGLQSKENLRQYAGIRDIPVPPGDHQLVITNPGHDWFEVRRYTFSRIARPRKPPLQAFGLAGRTRALLWIRNRQYTWRNAAQPAFTPDTINNATLTMKNLPPGKWLIETFDTAKGLPVEQITRETSPDDILTLELPPITRDIAFRLIRPSN